MGDVLQLSPERLELALEAWRLRQRPAAKLTADERRRRDELEARLDGRVYRLPAELLEGVERRVQQAARGAERIGVLPAMLWELDRRAEPVRCSTGDSKVQREVVTVLLVNGQVSPGNGWEYLGMISYLTTKRGKRPLLRRLPSAAGVDLSRLEGAQPDCEHCQLRRTRARTFIVRSPDGEIRQVGYRCLGDYIGDAPEAAARYAERLLDLADLLGDSEAQLTVPGLADPSRSGFFDASDYLAWVAREVRLHGWTGRREAWERSGVSSADAARSALLGALGGSLRDAPSAADRELAEQTWQWISRELVADAANAYQRDLAGLAREPLVSYRQLPLLASALPAYQRLVDRRARHADAAARSTHLGNAGDRLEVIVEVCTVTRRDSDFGVRHIYLLEDPTGNQLTWFSSAAATMDVGQRYRLRGTVKRHDLWQGVARTVLTRCQVLETL